jgi:uncharacterized damage-inducible protein DinB
MNLRFAFACCLLAMSSIAVSVQAQSPADQGPAAGTIVTPASTIDSELGIIEYEVMGAAKAMPADKYGFAPSQAIFVPSQTTDFATVRTFAQQATHLAQANYFFGGLVSGLKPDTDVRAIDKLNKKDDVVAALASSFAFMHKAIGTLTAANAFEVIKTPEPGLQTRSTMAMFCVAHANDHYGQMVEYLRMNGLVPPASAK